MNLTVEVVEENEESILYVSGEIDTYTAPKLKEALLPLTQRKGNTVVVNLEKVSYMDSTGLGIFVSGLKSTKEHESSMKLVHLQDRVLRIFEITGLDSVIDIRTGIRGGNE